MHLEISCKIRLNSFSRSIVEMDKNNMKIWMDQKGISFLKNVGIRQGQTVLDFGCGEGFYSIPAAKLVGMNGKVYAVDKDTEVLSKLIKRTWEEGLKNVISIGEKHDLSGIIENRSVDVALLYDILHYLDTNKRVMSSDMGNIELMHI